MFFSNNRIGSMAANVTVEAAAGYDNEHAIYDVMIESCENQEKLFTAAIFCDMQEAAMLHEGAAVEDIEAFQEASIKGFIDKLKEMIKKLWAKIKAVFHAFIAKLNSWFMKSGKEFASKYEKELSKKDLSKFKIKIQKPKGIVTLKTPLIGVASDSADMDESELRDKALKALVGADIESSGFEKSFHELCFEDEDEVTGSEVVTSALKRLKDKDVVKSAETSNKAIDKTFKNLLDVVDKAQKENPNKKMALKASDGKYSASGSTNTYSKDAANAHYSQLRRIVKAYQSAVQMCTSAVLREAKFQAAQDRRIVAKAVAYNPEKHMNEEADMLSNFIAEAAEWELLTDLR